MAITKKLEELGLNINVEKVDNEGNITPWMTISKSTLDEIDDEDISEQLRFWGIAKAKSERILAIRQREHRRWRSRFQQHATDPHDKPDGWKKPTEKMIEAAYRTSKVYREQNEMIEKSAETAGIITAIVAGLNAKSSN